MATFFSGTDTTNLHESAEFFNYYLSLIVNHSEEYCAKVSMKGRTETESKSTKYFRNAKGNLYYKTETLQANEECIFVYNCDITIDRGSANDDNADQITKLKSTKTSYKYYNQTYEPWKDSGKAYGSQGYSKNKAEHIARLPHSLEGSSTLKEMLEDWDDDFSTLKPKKQLSMFPDKEDGPEANHIENILEDIIGVKVTSIDFNEYLQCISVDKNRAEYLKEAQESLATNMQYVFGIKKSKIVEERANLINDVRRKLTYHSYLAPQELFEILKEAFDNEFKYNV